MSTNPTWGRHILDERGEEAGRSGVRHDRGARAPGRLETGSHVPASPSGAVGVGLGTISAGRAPFVSKPRSRTSWTEIAGREDPDRELGHIALSLCYRNQTVPSQEAATSVGAWPTGMTPTTPPSCGSIWTRVPSALLAAKTAPSVAHRPTSPLPTGIV